MPEYRVECASIDDEDIPATIVTVWGLVVSVEDVVVRRRGRQLRVETAQDGYRFWDWVADDIPIDGGYTGPACQAVRQWWVDSLEQGSTAYRTPA